MEYKAHVITIDCGNSGAKAVLWEGDTALLHRHMPGAPDIATVAQLASHAPHIQGICACSVAGWPGGFIEALGGLSPRIVILDADTPLPMPVDYDRCKLGTDRVAAAVGAVALTGASDILVVDAGTAITLDAVRGGRYCGGSISPGIALRLAALHEHTAALPSVGKPACDAAFPAHSTSAAMTAGAVLGAVAEIEYYHRLMPAGTVVALGGGDAKLISEHNPRVPLADIDPALLVPAGLKRIFDFQP